MSKWAKSPQLMRGPLGRSEHLDRATEPMANTGQRPRVPKPIELRVRDCEAHLHFLEDALRLYPSEFDRYKQIAAELRVLVVRHGKSNRALLLDLLDEIGIDFPIAPRGEPFTRHPVAVVGADRDPTFLAWRAAVNRLQTDPTAQAEVDRLTEKLRPTLALTEYLDRGLAVSIGGREYSHKQLIQAISQQMGGSHEDVEVDAPIAEMHSFEIGGDPSYVAALLPTARLVVEIGEQFIRYLSKEHGFRPSYLGAADG